MTNKIKVVKEVKEVVKYVRVHNNMRCGWVMPRGLLDHVPLDSGDKALSPTVLYSKKSRVAPSQSVIIEKVAFERFLENKQSGTVNKVLKNMLDKNCLKVSGVKGTIDYRDYVDAPVKTKPSSEDLFGEDGSEKPILQTQAVTIDVTKKDM